MSDGMSDRMSDGMDSIARSSSPLRPLTVLVCALGGEGGGVLAEWLYGTAVRAGHAAQATSIPGVAQRTGATTYYIEVWPSPMASHPGRRPAFSLSPVPGGVDLLVSSELLETARQVGLGMVSPDRTTVLSSTGRTLTTAEKVVPADGRADTAALAAAVRAHARAAELVDFGALARDAGTVVSAVLLGAIAGSGVLPFARDLYEATVRATGKGVDASLRGFGLAYDAIRSCREGGATRNVSAAAGGATATVAVASASTAPDLRALGRARVASYQDEAYARLYDERLDRFATIDADGAIRSELARWLALWMAFDDIVRVAALKLAAGRVVRVRREVEAGPDDVVRVFDHFKPGVPELAGLLPARWAARLEAWDRRRVAAGQEPWALPLRLGTHTVGGVLALRVAAGLRGWRRRGRRFAEEQALIERWLAAVAAGARRDPALGLELARCGQLVKGYGSTNERGKRTLLHIVDHLAASSADAVRAARDGALADDAGRALDAALQAHGAPPRPPLEQVVRLHRRRPSPTAASARADAREADRSAA